MLNRFWAVFRARNLEFFRDRSSLAWNVMFPMLMLVGFSFIFDSDGRTEYKVGVVAEQQGTEHPIADVKYIQFVDYQDVGEAKAKLKQHGVDMLIYPQAREYWLNDTSPKGYLVEQILLGRINDYQKQTLTGRQIRYLDWVVPGILGMNMMFSCLFGVGYVIVRYRKSAVLKRLKATPLSAFEFLLAQVASRLFIVMAISSLIFAVCHWMFDFYMLGSFWHLILISVLGAMSMISLGLLMASRSASEELTGGMLNLVSWPMMILSGVWFSLEGAPEFMKTIAQVLPLTHLIDGARAIMTEGASLYDIQYNIYALIVMTLVFLLAGAKLFDWQGDAR